MTMNIPSSIPTATTPRFGAKHELSAKQLKQVYQNRDQILAALPPFDPRSGKSFTMALANFTGDPTLLEGFASEPTRDGGKTFYSGEDKVTFRQARQESGAKKQDYYPAPSEDCCYPMTASLKARLLGK